MFYLIDPSNGPLVYCSKKLEYNMAFTNDRFWAKPLKYEEAFELNKIKPETIILSEEEFAKLELKQTL